MNPAILAIAAYILGLGTTVLVWQLLPFGWVGVFWVTLGGVAAWIGPRIWPRGPRSWAWLLAGGVACIASVYGLSQIPQPASNDISRFVPVVAPGTRSPTVQVQGKIISPPHLTRSQRVQFWLQPTTVKPGVASEVPTQTVGGKLYVTVPLLWGTGLQPNQEIKLQGILYKPRPATNPGGFDFKAYLAWKGSFAGMGGQGLEILDTPPTFQGWWWGLRQRIIKAQVQALGSPGGPLLSAMVLGGRVVDLPHDIREQFTRIGLAHTIAASGFHTTLLLGLVLTLTRRLAVQTQFWCGMGTLTLYVGLTGLQPSVLRAAFMGLAALGAKVWQRQIKPLGLLMVVATGLLIINPLWIQDLGFQLSFLATLGLLVTVPSLQRQLDWLPPAIATLIAVPLAASLWTLPRLLYGFGLVSPYGVLTNLVVTPLIALLSLGGMVSAGAALFWGPLGAGLAWLLQWPMDLLLAIAQIFSQLPGTTVATGTISLGQLLSIYGLMGMVWWQPWWQRRWWLVVLAGLMVVFGPAWITQGRQVQATILAASDMPVMTIQDRGQVGLINPGDKTAARLTVLPFLQQQGINRIDWGLGTRMDWEAQDGWRTLRGYLPITQLYGDRTLNVEGLGLTRGPITTTPNSILLDPREWCSPMVSS